MGFRHVEPTAKAALWPPAFPKNVPGCCWDVSNVPSSQGSLRLLIRKKKNYNIGIYKLLFSPNYFFYITFKIRVYQLCVEESTSGLSTALLALFLISSRCQQKP